MTFSGVTKSCPQISTREDCSRRMRGMAADPRMSSVAGRPLKAKPVMRTLARAGERRRPRSSSMMRVATWSGSAWLIFRASSMTRGLKSIFFRLSIRMRASFSRHGPPTKPGWAILDRG